MTDSSKMPARILCDGIDAALCKPGNRIDSTTRHLTAYIRADLAEQMAEALRSLPVEWLKSGIVADDRSDGIPIEMRIVGTSYEAEITVGDLRKARAALSAWETNNG